LNESPNSQKKITFAIAAKFANLAKQSAILAWLTMLLLQKWQKI
jgi:hypothetical protein